MRYQPPNPVAGTSNSPRTTPDPSEYSPEERNLLLRLAHDAIEALVLKRSPVSHPANSHLTEFRGVFTTLYLHGKLRGCVGYVSPIFPLHRAVFETARAAASQDTRFDPVTSDELHELLLSLSILSPLHPIDASEVEIGKHGLVVTLGIRRGLLLPQVAMEHGWSRQEFLEQTCRKAGLATDAWKSGAVLEAFTAEVFGDAGGPE
jgi:AmmeMemoRadiSam system protein A